MTEIAFELSGPHIVYALGINHQRDIAGESRVDPTALADPTKPFADMLKVNTQDT